MTEHDLQNLIKVKLSDLGYVVFRVNVIGAYTRDGRYIPPTVPAGFSDLFTVKDGRVSFIEVKVRPNKPTEEQLNFIDQMRSAGCSAGVAYSVEDAVAIAGGIPCQL